MHGCRRGAALAAPALALLCLAPGLEGAEREVRLAFLGDTGTGGKAQKAVRDRLLERAPAWVFLLGDNVYARGSARHIRDRYEDVYAPLFARGTRFHAALGNHDVVLCGAATADPLDADAGAYRWRDPGCDVEEHLARPSFGYEGGRRYYSVTLGQGPEPLAEVFVLDSNTLRVGKGKLPRGREDGAQLEWLDGALAASRARWKIVALHHPPHSPRARGFFFGIGGHGREEGLDAQLAPLLTRHGVDAVFAGHNHLYARMAPQGGIRYFVAGGGGRGVYGFKPAPGYVASGGAFHHFVEVRLTDARFEYAVVDDAGRVRDAGSFAEGDAADAPGPIIPGS